MEYTAKTDLYALIGHPVSHSLSPTLHNRFFSEHDIDGVYLAFDVAPDSLAQAVGGLKAVGISGMNVTIPHKETVMAHLDGISEGAFLAGAVNTVVREGSPDDGGYRYIGHNTDGIGLVKAFETNGIDVTGRTVTLIGAGGAAKGILAAFLKSGVRQVRILNRSIVKAEELAALMQSSIPGEYVIESFGLEDFVDLKHDIIIQTTSVGMGDGMSPVDSSVLSGSETVCDIVYKPKVTPLLEVAITKGCHCIYGGDMLFHQAMLAEELWQGKQFDTCTLKTWFDTL